MFSSSTASDTDSIIDQPTCVLAPQNDFSTATVSFASADTKNKMLKRLAVEGWEFDDRFDGLTVLRAAEEIDVE